MTYLINSSEEFYLFKKSDFSVSLFEKKIVFGTLLSLLMLISIFFTILGAWMVLPFAGIEMLFLLYAYFWLNKHDSDYEKLCKDGVNIILFRKIGGKIFKRKYNFEWLNIEKKISDNGNISLYLVSRGEKIEICSYLNSYFKNKIYPQVAKWIKSYKVNDEN